MHKKRAASHERVKASLEQDQAMRLVQSIPCFLISILAAGAIHYLHHFDPVNYTRMIAEDQWGEYATVLCFAMAGIIMFMLIPKGITSSQRIIWFLIGLVCLFIAGEELSWGQRIFQIPTPEILLQVNQQRELSLHNIKGINNTAISKVLAGLLISWSILSVLFAYRFPKILKSLKKVGLPIIPLPLVPLFLLQPYFLLLGPVAKSDEIGELFLAVAALAWASDLSLRHNLFNLRSNVSTYVYIGSLFAAAGAAAFLLTRYSPGDLGWRLNLMAARDYPALKMHGQALKLYDYLHAHPEYLASDTWVRHCALLLALNRPDEAGEVLMRHADGFYLESTSEGEYVRNLQRKKTVAKWIAEAKRGHPFGRVE